MKVSCHLITWGEDFQTGMREARALGYSACETFTHIAMQYADRVDEFKDLLASNGLQLSALYAGGHFSDHAKRSEIVDFNTSVAKLLSAVGADRIVFGPGIPRTPGGTTLEELKQCAITIDRAAEACFELGVLACVHPHLFTEIQDRRELDAIMEMTNPNLVFFCPDTAHLTKAGMDAAEAIRTYGQRVRYVHLKDVTPESPEPDVFEMASSGEALPIFCELGLGTVDLVAAVNTLREIRYEGWVTIEIDRSTSNPLQSLRVCRDYAEQELNLTIRENV